MIVSLTQMLSNRHQIMAEMKSVAGMGSSVCHSHLLHQGNGLQLRADIVGDVR